MQHCGRQRALLNLLREANYVPRVAKLSTTETEGRKGEGGQREKTMKKQVASVYLFAVGSR